MIGSFLRIRSVDTFKMQQDPLIEITTLLNAKNRVQYDQGVQLFRQKIAKEAAQNHGQLPKNSILFQYYLASPKSVEVCSIFSKIESVWLLF